uniref:Uncharacterized protein n=1 Tax=Lygus hesperus TaxID=30085 RepID=A0A0A9Y5M9_LYGHE
MSQAVYNVITAASLALSLICVASVPTTLKSTLKIVNSTNIRELKHNFAVEDKAVAYVYPVGTDESAQSSWTASVSLPKTEAERMAAPKKHSSQVKDSSLSAKPTANPTVKTGKDYPANTGTESTTEKLEDKMVTSAAESLKTRSDAESKQNNTSLEITSTAPTLSETQRNQNATRDNGKPDCFTRVLSEDDDDKLIVYNSTRQEVEAKGLEVFDTVCKGDDDWDKVISAGALASLCCGSG